ncbi:MAG: hypothetical protein V3V12_02135 [Gammaproteobacteria bacterium]
MGQLNLTVPAQSKQDGKASISVRELESWLDNLPQVNLVSAFVEINEKLHQLNRQSFPAQQRMELQSAIARSTYNLKHYLQPSDYKKNPDLKNQVRQNAQETTFTYKIIALDIEKNPPRLGHKKFLQQALVSALEALTEYSLFYYNDYQKLPAQLWNEATIIYRYAQNNMLELDATHAKSGSSISLNQAYQTFAILKLSDPYQIQPGSIWALHEYLKTLPVKTLLMNSGDTLQANQSPITISKSTSISEYDLLINVSPLYEQIEADIHSLTKNIPSELHDILKLASSGVLKHTLKRALSSLSNQIERKSDRIQTHQRFEIAVGLAACCHLMTSKPDLDNDPDNDDLILSSQESSSVAQAQYAAHACTSINRNAGGLALRFENKHHLPIQVGQIIGIHKPGNNNENWVIGVCRWMTEQTSQRSIDLGIQYLTQKAMPASLNQGNTSKQKPPALASLQKQGNQQIATLITPAGFYKENRGLELCLDDQSLPISCLQLIESTSLFERFIYKSASKIATMNTQQLSDPPQNRQQTKAPAEVESK